jgi:uncharacterized circularly permuted ATP-grasp superfamily protein/uncharacterized alpha-E superfamily protein
MNQSSPSNSAQSTLSKLLESYRPPNGRFDELLDEQGQLRAHWQPLIDNLNELPPRARQQAIEYSQTMVLDHDVTYQPQGGDSAARPWQFDLLPFVLANDEYNELADGLSQRTQLLDAIVADCLGPQELLAEGLLPPAVIFGNNTFLPACHGAKPRGDKYLYLAGFDIARAPNGRWWVVRNRMSTPAGLGYALEARMVSSKCLPDVFEQSEVARVARFFRTFSNSLVGLSGNDEPLNLILTAQHDGRDYFDHNFLGRYLGHGVVNGADLTVRDSRVFLKTTRGLQPVDLLVRRIDTGNCDPLEMSVDSLDGVPGLMQAVRAGRVAMANWPGAEIANDPSLNSFLPRLCQRLLGEDLKLPSVASWWCGQPNEREYVLDNIDGLVIRRLDTINRISRDHRSQSNHYVGSLLNAPQRDQLIQLIRQFPDEFVAQEPMQVSVAPSWNEQGQIVAAETSLRLYVTAAQNEPGYYLMPGGLARAETRDPRAAQSMRLPNAMNKDIWVNRLDDVASAAPTMVGPAVIQRSDRNLASRTADNMFWLGAYLERAENAARLLRSLIQQTNGEAAYGQQVAALDRLAAVLVGQGQLSSRRARRLLAKGRQSFAFEIASIVFSQDNADSLHQIVGNIARTADLVRERLSPDMWRLLERLAQPANKPNHGLPNPLVTLRHLNSQIDTMAAVNGMISLNMTRADGWRFLSCGRSLERLQQSAHLFNELTSRPADIEQGSLNLLLEVSDCAITYRTRYGAAPQFIPVADLILADDSNPRSLLSQVIQVRSHFENMPHPNQTGIDREADKAMLRLESSLRLLDPEQLDERNNQTGNRTYVSRLCRQAQSDKSVITDRLTAVFFSHAGASRVSGQFGRTR